MPDIHPSAVKFCKRCNLDKSLSEFYPIKGGRGRSPWSFYCKQCESDRRKNRVASREQLDRYCAKTKEYQKRIRLEALARYSIGAIPRCACCGEHRVEFLTLDHINGDGAKHRRRHKISYLPIWLKTHDWPQGIQVLCYNCNVAKGTGSRCPHHKWDGVTIHQFTDIHGTAVIMPGTTIWNSAVIGEQVTIGYDCVIGSSSYIGRGSDIGDQSRLQTGVFLPNCSRVGKRVYIGPQVVCTDDKYPRVNNPDYDAQPPCLDDDCSIGARAVILPGISIGKFAMIGAGAVVTHDVPDYAVVVGSPGRVIEITSDRKLAYRNSGDF